MKPNNVELEKIIAEIHKCRTQRRAIQLAAGLVLCFTKNSYTEHALTTKFGDALCEPYEFVVKQEEHPT